MCNEKKSSHDLRTQPYDLPFCSVASKPLLPNLGSTAYRSRGPLTDWAEMDSQDRGRMMSRLLQGTIFGLVALVTGMISDSAQAQMRWGVSIGNGGGVRVGVGNGVYGPGYYGPGYYGPGYGPGYRYGYGPTPIVVAPQPVIVPQPAYVQPQPNYVQPLPQTYPSAPNGSVIPPSPTADGGEILLFSPTTNTGDIRYNLNGRTYTMQPGTKQKFTNDRTWTIQFESAPGQVATYTLNSAKYKFKTGETGIALYETQDAPQAGPSGLPPAPVPEPPEVGTTVIPSRPALKTTP